MTSELIILIYFIIDMMLRLQYMYIAGKRLGFWNVFTDENFLIHFTCEIMMIVDAILFYSIYPNAYFRFGRIFRAIKAVLESKEVYRTTISVLHWYPQIIDLACLLLIISFLYGLFGNRFLNPNTPGITVSKIVINLSIERKQVYELSRSHTDNLLPCNLSQLPSCITAVHETQQDQCDVLLPVPDLHSVSCSPTTSGNHVWSVQDQQK